MKTSCDLKGSRLIEELREFTSFTRQSQRFICASLDTAFCPDFSPTQWARNDNEAETIAAQKQVYKALSSIRSAIPHDCAPVDAEAFLYPLMEMTAFDISCAKIASFSQYRFLYERLVGARVRPWLATAFMAAVSLPYIPADVRQALIATAEDGLADDWSHAEPVYWPRWLPEDQEIAA